MQKRRTTLEDIANAVGLSKFSVSRALSGKAGVSDATREKVIREARQLGYYHMLASETQPIAQKSLRLVIPQADAIHSSFWIEVIAGADAEASKLGYRLTTEVVGTHPDPDLIKSEVAGLLLAGRRSRGVLEGYLNLPLPKVLIGHPRPMELIDSVQEALFDAGYATGMLLAELGHRKLAFFTDAPDDEGRNLRYAGLMEAMREVEGEVMQLEFEETQDGHARVLKALGNRTDPPTAFAAASDSIALNLMVALIEMGLRVPEELSIVGSTDSHSANALGVSLTTVRQPVHEIGQTALQTLHWRLTQAQPDARPRRTLLTPHLVARATHARADSEALRQKLAITKSD